MANISAPALSQLKTALEAQVSGRRGAPSVPYLVPALWAPVGVEPVGVEPQAVDPASWLLEHIRAIESRAMPGVRAEHSLNAQISGGTGGEWVGKSPIYNLFVRLGTAFDHDGDGCLGGAKHDLTLNRHGVPDSRTP